MKLYKKDIGVVVLHQADGSSKPLSIVIGYNSYNIEQIIEVRQSASKVGGAGLMYRVIIQNRERRIFEKQNKWWIESYKP